MILPPNLSIDESKGLSVANFLSTLEKIRLAMLYFSFLDGKTNVWDLEFPETFREKGPLRTFRGGGVKGRGEEVIKVILLPEAWDMFAK